MSLMIAVAYKDFIIGASDSRTVWNYYDPVTLEKSSYIEESNIKCEKVDKLTDFVLLSTLGHNSMGELFKKELYKRTSRGFDLKTCYQVSGELISDLRKGDLELTDKERDSVRYMDTEYFAAYMIGFNHNGITGMADLTGESRTVLETSEDNSEWPVIVMSPDAVTDLPFSRYLYPPINERSIESFLERIFFIHAHLSHKHSQQVSPDCNFHIIRKRNGMMHYLKDKYDTSILYKKLGLN